MTDYGLAAECFVFSWLLHRKRSPNRLFRIGFISFFGSLGLAALTGGTVHGFFLGPETLGYRILWPTTLLLLGITAVSVWGAVAGIHLRPALARRAVAGAVALFVLYGSIVIFITQSFWIAISFYLPAALSMLFMFSLHWYRSRDRLLLWGVMGFLLTFAAAAVQMVQVGLHPVYFNHNALYHLIQAVALFMIFRGGQWFITPPINP